MSFVRMPRRSQSLSGRTKRAKKKKATWDSTTSDLTVHKLSKDELDRRHAVHQSTNIDVIKEEKRRKAALKAQKERSLSEGNQAGLLREILYDEKQLNDALAHSDRVMSVVKDLFYDDPKRLKAIPHITRAPGGDAEKRRAGPIAEKGPHTSYLDVLSESVMDPSALNEYQRENDSEEEEETDEEEEEDGETPVFDSKLDVDRFQSYIHRAAAQQQHEKHDRIQSKYQSNKENMDPIATPERSPLTPSQRNAINDTAKAKKKMRSRSKAEGQSSLLDITQKTKPDDLKMYLTELMTACSAFDKTRGEAETVDASHSFTSGFPQLSGYTAFLVQTLTKILKHLTQSETRLDQEREARRGLEQEIAQQRKLIDAMTVDMMQSQELNIKIQAEARKQINQMEQRLQIVEHLLVNREFLEEKVSPPTAGKDKEDIPERGPGFSQDPAVSKPVSTATTVHLTTSNQFKTVQNSGLNTGSSTMISSALDSLQATPLTKSTLPIKNAGHIVSGVTGAQSNTSQVQFTTTTSLATSRNVFKSTTGTGHQVASGHQVPHLSQHTMERLMSSRPGQGRGNVHFEGNLKNIQTNVPSGMQSSRLLQSGDDQRAMDGIGSMSGFGVSSMMSSSVLKGTDPRSQGSGTFKQVPGAFTGSRQQTDTLTTSSGQHLRPIQPAMLLSPPRQKDRRDFIKPPGYQSQPLMSAPYGITPGAITSTNIGSNLSGGLKGSTHQPQAVFFGSRSQFSNDPSYAVRSSDPINKSRHPPQAPLLNNYTPNPDGQKEGAPSTISMDSSSTRYLSLPGNHGETNVVKNILQQGASDTTNRHHPSHVHPDRVGPNGQDRQHQQLSRNVHPIAMETVYESSLDGTVEPAGREDNSVDMNEKIASLSRQRVEAQARLEHLKDVYGGEDGMTAPQRPTTSGGEATDRRISTKPTGVLIGASPPVSPIAREVPSQRPMPTGTSHAASEGRTIHVSMPKLSELEISATSTPASKRSSIGSGGPSPGINQHDWKTPLKNSPEKEQFFALKAHIST
ncbi:uncharacterized protein LOC100893684 isoform X1 [Strongylocentrotus purpuratus]|uniref:Spindle and centriole-associated protein 1 n=1 Tax=Strongylocentrotus purpuratus TaxID=7668 RepID=A0A7M7GGR2_STRPU|nr:uncharacterized protein LOC100893684 isoform X1 [Strongylocentrotus purpuratus]